MNKEMDAAVALDPTRENTHWRENFATRSYVEQGAVFEDYGPAFAYGAISSIRYDTCEFEDVEPELSRDWANMRGKSPLTWERARHATRDAWERARQDNCCHLRPSESARSSSI